MGRPRHERFFSSLLFFGMLLVLVAGCAHNSTGDGKADTKDWSFWPALPQQPRIQYLMSLNGSQDITDENHSFREFVLGNKPADAFAIDKPYGVAFSKNRIYVTDVRANCVVIFDLARREVRLLGTKGAEKLIKPVAITVASDGIKYIADSGRGSVFVYDADDNFVTAFGHEGLNPVGVAVFGDELFISDIHGGRIEVMDRNSGKILRFLTFPKGGENKPCAPLGIAADTGGNLFITDVLNCRVLKVSPQGKILASLGMLGDGPGCFTRPKHVAVDSDGIVYVVDAAFQNVQMFNREGKLLLNFGDSWGGPGGMDLPAGVCVFEGDMSFFQKYAHPAFQIQRLILVTNQFGLDKVAVYALGQQRPGKTIAPSMAIAIKQPASRPTSGPVK